MRIRFPFFKKPQKKLEPDSIGIYIQTIANYFKNVNLSKILILESRDYVIFKNNFESKKMSGILIEKQLEGRVFFPKIKYEQRYKNIFINKLKKANDIFIFQKKKSIFKRKSENILNLILIFPIKTTLDLIRF